VLPDFLFDKIFGEGIFAAGKMLKRYFEWATIILERRTSPRSSKEVYLGRIYNV
jgi:hypothetical protein